MKTDKKTSKPFSNPIYRPILQLVVTITVVFLIAIGSLVWTSWRNLYRIQPIHHHLEFLTQLQQLDSHFQEYQNKVATSPDSTQIIRKNLINHLNQLIVSKDMLEISTISKLQTIRKNILENDQVNLSFFENYRNTLQGAVSDEIKLHNAILLGMSRNTTFEFYLSLVVTLIFIFGLILFLFFFRNQILLPLLNLNGFITLLAEREYKTMPMENIEPLLLPLFSNYNYMVSRLSELEKEHSDRRKSLEQKIRSATHVLVEQQRTLARSERLAILGEFVAGIAHELRNPLAGIQMALVNLRQDLESDAHKQQLDLITSELARTSRILNDVLKQARHSPEQAISFSMKEMVSNLVTLARYQIPPAIVIEYDIPDDDIFYLPQDGLRQALLNLILNASHAIDEKQGKINIKISRLTDAVEILVQDNGPGFPKKMLNSNIQPFATWKENGTGLGMAMVRRFINNLNGDLKLKNIEPNGALVTLKLPC